MQREVSFFYFCMLLRNIGIVYFVIIVVADVIHSLAYVMKFYKNGYVIQKVANKNQSGADRIIHFLTTLFGVYKVSYTVPPEHLIYAMS